MPPSKPPTWEEMAAQLSEEYLHELKRAADTSPRPCVNVEQLCKLQLKAEAFFRQARELVKQYDDGQTLQRQAQRRSWGLSAALPQDFSAEMHLDYSRWRHGRPISSADPLFDALYRDLVEPGYAESKYGSSLTSRRTFDSVSSGPSFQWIGLTPTRTSHEYSSTTVGMPSSGVFEPEHDIGCVVGEQGACPSWPVASSNRHSRERNRDPWAEHSPSSRHTEAQLARSHRELISLTEYDDRSPRPPATPGLPRLDGIRVCPLIDQVVRSGHVARSRRAKIEELPECLKVGRRA